jgi:N-acylneuraminate cytidylyltransferase
MKIVTIIPARSGSKGIPDKNIADINGKPLIAYNIRASLDSIVDETWVSTDSEEYKWISACAGANVLMRPDELATDDSSSEDVLMHFAENVEFDLLVFLQCTSPLTTSEDINGAIDHYIKGGYDSLLSVCPDHGGWLCGGFTWEDGEDGPTPLQYDYDNRPRRQDMNPHYRENGAIYLINKSTLIRRKCRLGDNVGIYVMPRERSFEIDEPEDLDEIRKHLK